MELDTGAGYADLLFLTPASQIILVETKLWRNVEARREVVAQILDYAKMLTRWKFDELDSKVAKATKQGPGFILRTMRERFAEFDERAFINGVSRNLATGDMLLLIAGDKIRPSTEALVDFMEAYGSLRFTFGLVEIAAHAMEGGILLQPRVLAKTELIRRTIFIPQMLAPDMSVGEAMDSLSQATEESRQGESPEYTKLRDWYFAFWTEFVERLKLDDNAQRKPNPTRDTNVFLSMPPSGGSCWMSAYIARGGGMTGVYLTWLRTYSLGRDTYEALLASREEIEEEVGQQLEWEVTNDGKYSIATARPIPDLNSQEGREEVMLYLLDKTNRMVNALRGRIQDFLNSQKRIDVWP